MARARRTAGSHSARFRPRGTGRAIPALLALLVWCGGFEIAPALHAIDHESDHTHGAAARASAHCHDEACHDRGARAVGSPHEGEPAPDPDHGEGALLHRGLAAHTAPPAVPPFRAPWSEAVCTRHAEPAPVDPSERDRPRARAHPGSNG